MTLPEGLFPKSFLDMTPEEHLETVLWLLDTAQAFEEPCFLMMTPEQGEQLLQTLTPGLFQRLQTLTPQQAHFASKIHKSWMENTRKRLHDNNGLALLVSKALVPTFLADLKHGHDMIALTTTSQKRSRT